MEGIRTSKNLKNGFMSVWLHYSADPKKDTAWAQRIRDGMLDENSYLKEYELDFSALEGTKVFAGAYNSTIHLLQSESEENEIDLHNDRGIYVGLDWGFRHPAMLLTQFTKESEKRGDEWRWLREFVGENMQVTTFLDVVCYLLGMQNFPHHSEAKLSEEAKDYIRVKQLEPFITEKLDKEVKFKFFVDIAGSQTSDKGEKTNINICQSRPYCFALRYKKVYIEPGITLLAMRFRVRKDGYPGIRFSSRCQIVLDGLQGGFVRNKRGEVADTIHTHLFDGGRYIIMNVSDIYKEQRYLKDEESETNKLHRVATTTSFIPKKIPKRAEDKFIVNRMPERREIRQFAHR